MHCPRCGFLGMWLCPLPHPDFPVAASLILWTQRSWQLLWWCPSGLQTCLYLCTWGPDCFQQWLSHYPVVLFLLVSYTVILMILRSQAGWARGQQSPAAPHTSLWWHFTFCPASMSIPGPSLSSPWRKPSTSPSLLSVLCWTPWSILFWGKAQHFRGATMAVNQRITSACAHCRRNAGYLSYCLSRVRSSIGLDNG